MTQIMFWRSIQELIRKNKGSGISNSGFQLGHDLAGYWQECCFTPLRPGFSTCTSCCSWLAPGNLSLRALWPDGLWNDRTFCPQLGVAPTQRQSLNPMKPRNSFSHGTLADLVTGWPVTWQWCSQNLPWRTRQTRSSIQSASVWGAGE